MLLAAGAPLAVLLAGYGIDDLSGVLFGSWLGQSDYGNFGIAVSDATFFAYLASLGADEAVPRFGMLGAAVCRGCMMLALLAWIAAQVRSRLGIALWQVRAPNGSWRRGAQVTSCGESPILSHGLAGRRDRAGVARLGGAPRRPRGES